MKPVLSFASLTRSAVEGLDFMVEARDGGSGFLVMAPHGGGIEPGTDVLAGAIAGERHGYYAFVGIRPRGNRSLHLPSRRFDEPRAVALTRCAHTVISIHGCRETAPVVYVGGLDAELKKRIARNLGRNRFTVESHPPAALRGVHPGNLCNRGLRRRGIQLEISAGLRQALLGRRREPNGRQSDAFRRFVSCVGSALQ